MEVIADDESEIAEAVVRMSEKYDFVITSGGIGPTSVTHFSIYSLHLPPEHSVNESLFGKHA